jgi:hypothetical protein
MVVVVVEGDVGSVVVLEVDMVGGTDAQLQSHPLKTKHSSQLLGVGSERSFSVVSEHRVSLLVSSLNFACLTLNYLCHGIGVCGFLLPCVT